VFSPDIKKPSRVRAGSSAYNKGNSERCGHFFTVKKSYALFHGKEGVYKEG